MLIQTLIDDGSCADGRSGIDLYYFQDDGSSFKVTILYDPYFYVVCNV
jgi:DNA polymerase epsilon subunit 1